MCEIVRASPDQASTLTHIAVTAKRHWGYPERWIEIWAPILTVTPEFVAEHDTYIAWVNGRQTGFYSISVEAEKASLEHLWMLPDHMGLGIGKALFEHALARCRETGAGVLEIESDPNARGFYERMGAKKTGEIVSELDGELRVLPVLEMEL